MIRLVDDTDIMVFHERDQQAEYEKKRTESYAKYKDAEVVFEEGSDGKEVYFILSGKAEVSQRIGGRKEIVAILKKGNFFGEMAALNGDVRTMTVTAMGELDLCELSPGSILEYMQRSPEILRDMCTSLAGRLRDTNLKAKELTFKAITSDKGIEERMTDTFYADKLNILVVDDHPQIAAALKRLLSDEYNVFTALDGKSALRVMELHDIALVLSDYRMPGMSGTELLENVKHMYPDAIRVIFSGHFDQGILMKAIGKVQVHGVLPKPWKDEEVEFTVARWTEQYKRAKRLEEKAEQYAVVQKQLEKANELIEQLMQELKEANTSEHQQMGFWWRWKRKRG